MHPPATRLKSQQPFSWCSAKARLRWQDRRYPTVSGDEFWGKESPDFQTLHQLCAVYRCRVPELGGGSRVAEQPLRPVPVLRAVPLGCDPYGTA